MPVRETRALLCCHSTPVPGGDADCVGEMAYSSLWLDGRWLFLWADCTHGWSSVVSWGLLGLCYPLREHSVICMHGLMS